MVGDICERETHVGRRLRQPPAQPVVRRGPVLLEGAAVPDGAGTATPVDDDAALSRCLRRVIFDAALRRAMADAAWQAGQALPGWPAQAALFLQQVG